MMKGIIVSQVLVLALALGSVNGLQAHVALNYPQGGETFITGDTITVQWQMVIPHNTLNWDLFFSSDGGTTWDTLQIDIPPEDLSYQWEIPAIATAQGRVLVIMDNDGTDYQHSSMDFTITLTPPPPSIAVAAQDTTIECSDPNQAAAIQTWLDNHGGATATGFCGNLIWTNDFTTLSDSCGASGSALVTFTATDDCGNNTTSATLTIVDSIAPGIDLPAVDLTVECDGNGNLVELNSWLDSQGGAMASDGCGNVTWTDDFSTLSDSCGMTGNAFVTFVATDDCGNSSTTTATFTIEDLNAPNIDVAAQDTTIECGILNQTTVIQNWLDNYGGALASDSCGNVTWTNNFSVLPDTCLALDSLTVTFTATDECGNSSTTDAVITFLGTTGISAPSLSDFNLEVFPNPSTGTIWLKSQPSDLTIRSIEVFDLSGRLIHETIWQNSSSVRELRLGQPVEGFKFLKIQTDAGTVTRKIEILKN